MTITRRLGIVGVGLMGGSVGLAARRSGQFDAILGYDASLSALQQATARGCIDQACPNLAELARSCDTIVIAAPVNLVADLVTQVAAVAPPETLLTDTGSTKERIVRNVESLLPADRLFVGSHPLCGSEKHGPEAARGDLFDGRLVLLTPTPRTTPPAVARASEFWQRLGGRVQSLSPQEHDRVLALTSHLPHLAASALASLLPSEWRAFVANGFRDTTRLASGDPALWAAILNDNAPRLAPVIQQLQARLDEFRSALETGDTAALLRLLADAKGIRDDLGS
ncbi:MAG: prephenate dehydrogenase [Gemmataceae bacterium]|nr:prephenate dehydrogenase [Gemmataceae bacterium]